MKNNPVNDNRYNEVEFLKMYLRYFENLIDPEVKQRWKIERNDEKLYEFCDKCIDRIKLLIDYAIQSGSDINRPSDASLEIATVYQTLLEHFEEERFQNNITANMSIDTYMRSKRVLLKQVEKENAEALKELCHSMEEAMPEYSEMISSQELGENKDFHYKILLENIQTLKQLKRFRELQNLENALFFTTPEESKEEFNEIISCYIRK